MWILYPYTTATWAFQKLAHCKRGLPSELFQQWILTAPQKFSVSKAPFNCCIWCRTYYRRLHQLVKSLSELSSWTRQYKITYKVFSCKVLLGRNQNAGSCTTPRVLPCIFWVFYNAALWQGASVVIDVNIQWLWLGKFSQLMSLDNYDKL